MTYVREQTSAELAAHMRRLQAMPGWFDPLADRLWQEVQSLQRDNAALMEDAAAQIQIAREATERAEGLEKPTLEMIQAGLAVRWPALYRDCLYGEHDGIHLRAETETRINMMRQQYLAMVGAAVSHKED